MAHNTEGDGASNPVTLNVRCKYSQNQGRRKDIYFKCVYVMKTVSLRYEVNTNILLVIWKGRVGLTEIASISSGGVGGSAG